MDYNYGYDYNYNSYGSEMNATSVLFILLITLVLTVLLLVSLYKILKKAGRKGWESLIPVYNIFTLIQIAGLSVWYIILFIVPFVNIYAIFKIYIELAHKFGKSTGFGVGIAFFPYIFLPVLAFSKARYSGLNENAVQNYNQNNQYNNNGYNSGIYPTNVPNNNYSQPNNMNNNHNQANMQQYNNNINPPLEQPSFTQNNYQQQASSNYQSNMNNQSMSPFGNVNNNQVNNYQQTNQFNTPSKKYCPNCGNQLDINSDTCYMCGHKF